MSAETVTYKPIGVIHSDHHDPDRTPIQPVYAESCVGRVTLHPEYAEGLRDIEGFSHVYLIYDFHLAGASRLVVRPFMQDVERGVFATRSPRRPNPIGLSVVEIVRREENSLIVKGVDILDGTPLLDIKPYTERFDRIETTRNGWQDDIPEETARKRGERRV